MTLNARVKRQVLACLALTFALSWGGVVAVVGLDGFPGRPERFAALLPWVVLAMLAGPSFAGVFSTWLFAGRAGLRDLRSRLLRWRVGARWYAVALLTAPLVVAGTLLGLERTSQAYRWGIASADRPGLHLLLGLVTGLAAGTFEELGWTGFVIPKMRLRYGPLSTGLLLGLVWGAWHFLVTWWGSGSTLGSVPRAAYLSILLFSFLPPYRVLMVWVYDRTGSLLVAMLMHASLTASVRIFDPLAISGWPLLIYNGALGAVLWALVAGLLLADRGRQRTGPSPGGNR